MSKFAKFLNESKYNNWVFPDDKTIISDFNEYKKKEERKWKSRSQLIGSRYPIFNDLNHFKKELKKSKIVKLTKNIDRTISNRSNCSSIKELKSLVSSYIRPRDVDRIVNGFENNEKIPMPIVIEGNISRWIMAGNTRLDTSFILGIEPKVIWVNVKEN